MLTHGDTTIYVGTRSIGLQPSHTSALCASWGKTQSCKTCGMSRSCHIEFKMLENISLKEDMIEHFACNRTQIYFPW